MIYSATGGLILVTVLLAIWALPHWQAAKEARRRLLSSSLPVVILAPKTGAILDANTRAIREFSLSLNNGRLGFPEIADIAALKSVLQGVTNSVVLFACSLTWDNGSIPSPAVPWFQGCLLPMVWCCPGLTCQPGGYFRYRVAVCYQCIVRIGLLPGKGR